MSAAVKTLLFLLCCLVVMAASSVAGSDSQETVAVGPVPSELLGPWHTTGLHGDFLFLIIREIGVNMNEDATFTAWAVMHNGKRFNLEGTYTVEGEEITFQTNNDKRHGKLRYMFRLAKDKQKNLVLHDPHFGVTADLQRKQ